MAETLKEFLVGIGYRVDEASQSKFLRGVNLATKGVLALGATVAAVQVAVSAAVTKIAVGFDDLYWATQRTKSSAENIKSIGYAVSQLGGSYRGALGSIEAFSQRLRSNPGMESLVKTLGVATREGGKLRDNVSMITELAQKLQKRPYYIQLQYMEALGIDERTWQALQSGDLVRYTEEYRKKQEALGVSQTAAARIGKELNQAWGSLGATAAALGDKLLETLGPGLKEFVERIDAFLVRNSDKIVKFFQQLGDLAGELLKAFILLVEKGEGPIVEFLGKVQAGVDRLQGAFSALAMFLAGAFLIQVTAALGKFGMAFAALLLRFGLNPLSIGALALSSTEANSGEDEEIARRRANGTWGKTPTENGSARPERKRDNSWIGRLKRWWNGDKDTAVASNVPIRGTTFSQKAPGIMSRLKEDFGLTDEQAAAVMGNLGHESVGLRVMQEKNPTVPGSRGGWGWAQWTGSRRKAFEAWATARGLDPSSDEANYGFLRHELKTSHKGALAALKRAGSMEEGVRAFELEFEGAGIKHYASRDLWASRALAAARRAQRAPGYVPSYTPFTGLNAGSMAAVQSNAALFGSGIQPLSANSQTNNTTINASPRTEITILGGDPQATASAVTEAQNGVNGRLLRNMQGATR